MALCMASEDFKINMRLLSRWNPWPWYVLLFSEWYIIFHLGETGQLSRSLLTAFQHVEIHSKCGFP